MADNRLASAIFTAQFNDITIASFGFPRVNGSGSNESFHIGLRNGSEGNVEVKPRTFEDGIMRPVADRLYDVTMKWKQAENRIEDLQNAYKISNVSGGTFVGAQCWITMADGKILNFTKSDDNHVTPTAVGVVGFSFKYVNNEKECYIEWTGNVTITEPEYQLLVNTTFWSSATTGDGGGVSLNLESAGYSRSNYKVPGCATVTLAGNVYGIIDETFEHTIESVPNDSKDNEYRPINRKTKHMIKFGVPQTAAADLNRAITVAMQTDATWLFTNKSGETFTYSSGAIIINSTFTTGDKVRTQMYEGGGTIQNNPVEATPTYQDYGVTTPSVATMTNAQSA